ncbi:hypothetical protein DPEC_G00075800 [Dallia pectoralis]|uniref:Uncharacterized protein n=1 Tax=Dallia pectoralis TaxID=75939 RepID=A0ACC2H428_DALPE|nr:hypothetical protein DPEC_G00075800 [Dallia pectoralis]
MEMDNDTCHTEPDNILGFRLSVYYPVLLALGLVGNGLALVIVCKYEKLNTVANIFLLNLIISHLVVLFGLPFWAVYHHMTIWVFGRVWCKISIIVYFLGFYSSILFLTLMTFDRYLAVVYAVPSTRLRIFYCYIRIAMTVISSRMVKKYRTLRLIFVMVLLFFLCWTPYNVVLMVYMDETDVACETRMKYDYDLHATRLITYMYFCISPVFYTFVGRKFQNHLRNLIARQTPFLKEKKISTNSSEMLSHRVPQADMTVSSDVRV